MPQLCFQGSVPLLFSLPSLLWITPYSTALSRQFWATLETASSIPSPPFAKTDRISRASLSMSVSARLFSACIMFWTMTTPRWRRSVISLSNSACTISSQWVVWEERITESHVGTNRKINPCSVWQSWADGWVLTVPGMRAQSSGCSAVSMARVPAAAFRSLSSSSPL